MVNIRDIRLHLIIGAIVYLSFSTFNYAFAIDNNCPLSIIHILQVTPALLCLENRIDTLENAPIVSGSESTICNNLGSIGVGIVATSINGNCDFKSLVAGSNIVLTANGTRIMINSTGGTGTFQPHTLLNATAHTDTVTQSPTRGSIVYVDSANKWNELTLKDASMRLRSDGADIQWYWNHIVTINGGFPTFTPTLNTDFLQVNTTGTTINLPDPTPWSQWGKVYTIMKLSASGSNLVVIDPFGSATINGASTYTLTNKYDFVTIIINTDANWRIIASNDLTVCSNLGSVGEGIYVSGNCDFKKLLAGTGISLSSNGTRITITNTNPDDTTCTNVGTGSQVYKDGECNFRTIIGSPDISVTQQTNTITIDYNGTSSAPLIGQLIGDVYFSLTKTNIGTGYVDVYVTAFDEEDALVIDCANITDLRITYIWDYVGVGTQQLRWVDASNNANVLYESPTFTADRDATDSDWFTKPAWCTGIVTIEQQGKSTTGTDDPIAKGYKISGR